MFLLIKWESCKNTIVILLPWRKIMVHILAGNMQRFLSTCPQGWDPRLLAAGGYFFRSFSRIEQTVRPGYRLRSTDSFMNLDQNNGGREPLG